MSETNTNSRNNESLESHKRSGLKERRSAKRLLDYGSKSWSDIQKDHHQYKFAPNFPEYSKARTTFYAREANTGKFNRFWKLQHGYGHTYEGWSHDRVRQEDQFTYRRTCVILSRADVSGLVRDQVLQQVMSENLQGFSRHYEGIDGAALGFACLYRYEKQERARDSHIAEVAERLLDIDAGKLIDYVWRKYADSNE